jgi:hypothetical protein
LEELQREREETLERMRIETEEGSQIARMRREEAERKRRKEIEDSWQEKEARSIEYYRTWHEERENRIKRQVIDDTFKAEDTIGRYSKLGALDRAKAVENGIVYDNKLRRIAELAEQKRRQREEADIVRRKLERERDEVMTSGLMSQNRPQSKSQLNELASRLGINLEEIRRKAADSRRGKRSDLQKPLPPMDESEC